jgi:multidrug resistance efflux pump
MQSEPAALREPVESTEPARPVSARRAALISLVALGAGIAATLWFEQVRYERFPGYLQARLRTVSAVRDAQVSEILVTSGTVVTAGQPLIRLKDPAFEQRLEAKQRQIESLEIELSQSQARLEVELEWRRKNVLEGIFEARLKCVQALRRELQTPLELEYVRTGGWNSLPAAAGSSPSPMIFGDRPVVTPAAGDSTSASPQPKVSEAALCHEHILELERINRELPEKISRSMGVDLAKTRLDHARVELARLESQKQELTLVAEASGMVGVFQKEVGDHVSAHEPIVQLLDEEQPYLLLQIPSPRISDFSPGTIVDLKFPGGQGGNGRVDEIPPQTSPIPGENSAATGTVITAHVDPVGPLWPSLPFGSVVEVRRRR